MNAAGASVADLARLNFCLGELYADAVLKTQRQCRVKRRSNGMPWANFVSPRQAQVSWEEDLHDMADGEAAVIAARVGVPVVSDFRPADMARWRQRGAACPSIWTYFGFAMRELEGLCRTSAESRI